MPVRSGHAPSKDHRAPPKVLDSVRTATSRPAWGRGRFADQRRDRFRPSWTRPVRGAPEWVQDTFAVTPVVGTVMILAISVIGIAAVLTWGIPNVQQTQAMVEIEGVMEQFDIFDQVADQVMRGGAVGKASEVRFNMPSGQLQRTPGPLFVVSWSLYHDDFANTDRFWVQGLDDDPRTFTIQSEDTTNLALLGVQIHKVRHTTVQHIPFGKNGNILEPASGGFAGDGSVAVTLGEDIHEMPHRIQVSREIGFDDRRVIEEIWIFPLGSLVYERHTGFGNVAIRLENSVVISEFDTGRFIRSEPLTTVERNSNGDPTFVALFPMRYTANTTFPGVQAAGAGSYPMLFGLGGNHLRANGQEALAVTLKPIGPRADLWMDHYQSIHYGFTSNLPADDSVSINAGADPFKIVIMESNVEITLHHEGGALDRH